MTEHHQTQSIDAFLAKVMNLHATTAGMGGATAGIFGTSALGASSVDQLKRTSIDFAAHYRHGAPSDATAKLAGEIEGLLLVLQSMNVVSESTGNDLLEHLHSLR